MIELALPSVQNDLTPNQDTRSGYLQLKDAIDEVISLSQKMLASLEILVERVLFARNG